MRRLFDSLIGSLLVLLATSAEAEFHLYQIDQVYSNASGSVQFVVMHEFTGSNGENFWAGRPFTSKSATPTQTFNFPDNLPSSATASTHVLIATQGFADLGLVKPDFIIPNGFLALANGTVNYAGVDQVTYTALPTDGVTAIDRNGNTIPNKATNFAGKSASVTATTPASTNYEGLWWAAPAGSESGWGINFAHQGDTIFATWFTYDQAGKGLWLVMPAPKTATAQYGGVLYTTTGPAFSAVPFDPAQVVETQVGSGTLTFTDANNGTFAYTVNGISQTKAITRQVFGPLPSCATATASLTAATNYQDLWWAAPAGVESGWGINLTHQGDTIFATWFTYDTDHTQMWLVVSAPKTAAGVYSGSVDRTTGPAFNAVPFDPTKVAETSVGTATFTFSDGNNATFAYTVNGVTQSKAITREVFIPPGTVCQ